MSIPGRGWAYLGAVLGGAVSIAANVAHSYVPPAAAAADWVPHTGAVVGAIFWPVGLFVAVEIFARVAWPAGRRWTALRFLGLLPVASVAAVVSYRHLSGLLAFYGEDGLTVVIGPLAVDGLMVMATGALIATGQRRAVTSSPSPVEVPATVADSEAANPWAYSEPAVDRQSVTVAAPKRTPARPPARTSAAKKADTDTARKVAKLADRLTDIPKDKLAATIAARIDVHPRTVRRHLAAMATDSEPDSAAVNGVRVPDLVTTAGGTS